MDDQTQSADVGVKHGCLAFALALGAGLATFLFNPSLSFNLWDNFENFTPDTIFEHGLWLKGHLPILDVHQSLGVPLLGNAQSAVLYFPYTILLFLIRLVGGADQSLPDVMGLIHFGLAFAGWFCFSRALKIRGSISLLVATGLVGNGFFILGSETWQHIGAEYGWFPFMLLGAWGIVTGAPNRARWIFIFALSWTLGAWASHVQQIVYIGLHLALFAALLSWSEKNWRRAWPDLLGLGAAMIALALPAFAYSLAIRAAGQRSGALPAEIFFEGALTPKTLLGLLTPGLVSSGGLFGTTLTYLTFMGGWVWPGLGLVRKLKSRRSAWVLALLALLFLDFSLGPDGLIYPLTRAIPVWSSFRWPFKFTLHFLSMLALLAALALEQEWFSLATGKRYLLLGLAIALPFVGGKLIYLGLANALLVVSVLAFRNAKIWSVAIASFLYLVAALWVSGTQDSHRYPEQYGQYGAAFFGLDEPEAFRLAPLSLDICPKSPCAMQALSQFDSAVANGYLSLSGHQMGMSAMALSSIIGTSAWGAIPPNIGAWAVGSSLYRSLAVKYYLVSNSDLNLYRDIFFARGLVETKWGDTWHVLSDARAQALVNVPDEVVPVSASPDFSRIPPGGPNRALVQNLDHMLTPNATRISNIRWIEGRGLSFESNNTSSGESFAQVSLFPWNFMQAFRDGVKVPLYPTNAVALGVSLPRGISHFEVIASARLFYFTLFIMALGFGLLFGLARRRRP